MEDTKHTFNIRFKMLKDTTGGSIIENKYTWDVRPIYWTVMVIPGIGKINGTIDLYCMARDMVSPCVTFYPTSSVMGIPRMSYSPSAIFSSSTILSASPTKYIVDRSV